MHLHIRRGRRTDFSAVMQILAASGVSVPPPDRRTLRRFRYLVNDLGTDFYVADVDETIAGLVHVAYTRQLAAAPAARVEYLLVAADFRRRGIGSALLRFAAQRARRRGCGRLSCTLLGDAPEARHLLAEHGLTATGTVFVQEVLPSDTERPTAENGAGRRKRKRLSEREHG